MRLNLLISVGAVFLTIGIGQVSYAAVSERMAEPRIVDRGAHYRVWDRAVEVQAPDGRIVTEKHSYVELATGMHYMDGGRWKETREEIEIVPEGAIARQGPHKVVFAPNINTRGAIDLTAPDGMRLITHVLGLSYIDSASGRSVMIAEIKDSVGTILRPNQVIYEDAFTDVQADIRYTYRKSGFAQDIILREQLPEPEEFGLDSTTTKLEVLTEFLTPPEPIRRIRTIHPAEPRAMRDETLEFGVMRIGAGRAFSIDDEPQGRAQGIRVGKQFEKLDGRDFLIEQVPVMDIRAQINTLPTRQGASTSRKTNTIPRTALLKRQIPSAPVSKLDSSEMQYAKLDLARAGFVLDYEALNADQSDCVFQGDLTYYVTAPVVLSGTTTIEGGAVVKFANSPSDIKIEFDGHVECLTGPYRPAVFTAKDDNSFGEVISGSSGEPNNYYAEIALYSSGLTSGELHNLVIKHAGTGVDWDQSSARFYDLQIVHCGTAINREPTSRTAPVYNALIAHVTHAFKGDDVDYDVQHATINECGTLADIGAQGDISLLNCVLANVDSWGTYNQLAADYNGRYETPSLVQANDFVVTVSPFDTMGGAGSHYIVGNDFLNKGSDTIDQDLADSLSDKTIRAPEVYQSTTESTPLTLGPQGIEDTDEPDLGYHYDVLHYAFGGVTMNEDLVFEAGTKVGWFRVTSGWYHAGYGIHIADNKSVGFNGTAEQPVYWVRCNVVQEGINQQWIGGYGPGGISGWAWPDFNNAPEVNMRFTRCSMLGGYEGNHVRDDWGYLILNATDCEFRGGALGGYISASHFTNCLIERISVWWICDQSDPSFSMWNVTMHGGGLHLNRFNNGANCETIIHDTIFNQTDFTTLAGTYADFTHNAYVDHEGAYLTDPLGADDKVINGQTVFESSNQRDWYLVQTCELIDEGSRSASAAGLFHYTTASNNQKEEDTDVDIGYHYVAEVNGFPPDQDGDGIADYMEDKDGDGEKDLNESHWLIPWNGLKLWLAADEAYVTQDGAGKVSEWRDISGDERHCSQLQTEGQPTFVPGAFGSQDALHFDGSDYMECVAQVDLSGNTSGTWLAVVKPSSASTTPGVVIDNRQCYMNWRPGNLWGVDVYRTGGWVHGGGGPVTPPDYSADEPYVVLCTYDGAVGKHRIFVNGLLAVETDTATGTVQKQTTTALKVGTSLGLANYLKGDIAEIMIHDHLLQGAELASVMGYLENKYGLALQTPIPTEGVKLWLRADAGAFRASGSVSVSRWVDQSGTGNHLGQTVTETQPTFAIAGLNEKAAVHFDGSDYMECVAQVDLSGNTSGTWLAVVRPSSASTTPGVVIDNRQCYMNWRPGNLWGVDVYRTGGWVHGGTGPFTPPDYPTDLPYVVLCTYDGAVGKHRIFVNGLLAVETDTAAGTVQKQTTTVLKVGTSLGLANYLKGDIAEIMIHDHLLQGAELASVMGYLENKYGLALQAPIPTEGVKLWLRADAGAFRASGSVSVSRWVDQSGTGNHLGQTVTETQPTFATAGLNEKAAVHFDGSDYMECVAQVDLSGKTSGTWLAVVKPSSASTTPGVVIDNRQCYMNWRPGNLWGVDVYRTGGWVHGGGGPVTPPDYPTDLPYVVLCTYDGAVGKHRIFVNGLLAVETDTAAGTVQKQTTTVLKVGTSLGLANYLKGDIAEIMIHDHLLQGAELASVMGYLENKYGLALQAPVSTEGLKLWLRADIGVLRTGSAVTQWHDQSGNGNHVSQAVASAQPIHVLSGLNGQAVLRFDGTSDFLKCANQVDVRDLMAVTCIALVKPVAGYGVVLENREIFMQWRSGEQRWQVDAYTANGWLSQSGGGDKTPPDYPPNTTYFLMGIYDAEQQQQHRIFVNGALAIATAIAPAPLSSATSNPEYAKLKVGAYYTGDTSFFNGDIAEILIYDHRISAFELARIVAYSNSRYSLNLASDYDDDGLLDIDEFALALDPEVNQMELNSSRRNHQYDRLDRLDDVFGITELNLTLDDEGNITDVAP